MSNVGNVRGAASGVPDAGPANAPRATPSSSGRILGRGHDIAHSGDTPSQGPVPKPVPGLGSENLSVSHVPMAHDTRSGLAKAAGALTHVAPVGNGARGHDATAMPGAPYIKPNGSGALPRK
jgi:hypothetical protein